MIQGENLLLVASLVMTYLFFYYGVFVLKAERRMMDVIFNSFIYGLVIWKLSYGIVHPNMVLENPLTLLYFNGGVVGLVLAAVFIVFYTYWHLKKEHISFDTYIRVATPIYFGYWIVFLLWKGSGFPEDRFIWLQAVVAVVFFIVSSRMKTTRKLWQLFISFHILVFIFSSISDMTKETTSQQAISNIGIDVGEIAPDFELMTLKGKKMKLSQFRGKKVILNFWASWCPPCRAEMPEMQRFYEQYGQHVAIVAVNLTNKEKNHQAVETFINEKGVSFDIMLDEQGTVSKTYEVITIPTSYIIDEQGVIRSKHVGPLSYDMMKRTVLSE
ncbi:TlpA family protein disulfide reductase [Anoxybacillus sp. LAT_35]|uniref:Membrane-associated thiol-disulfide oxidoreductase n=1 Tax=Anoxybacillus flavithermus NBRC 109594 TaxID=1315967 RepID=R4G107_9BACL|nr:MULTISPECIES: TlpA disulfide reductase family protein [Anoxybacillus]MCG5026092.1 TlpA family protein disulfide reductase [Anoxybacillus flavithermus]MCG3084187.1 TlpA family protein disulfide reductase [Anoxybacillus sp. LAT27]MCG6170584.1 TlpA family protein disulfide reductase [Anoxybacillus sp. LAT_11]MCG6174725.1 TlpA family protein disulfide reductase [Anoxybacillus sp. LAT_31]MCG6177702.1 TlpA family protein disulfide reductase [Anoxybacillus sp. LAT_35]